MADVIMEMNGKRKRVPAEKVAYFTSKGAKVVPEAAKAPAAPAAHTDVGADASGHSEQGEPAAEQSQDESLPSFVTAPLKAAKWMAGGALLDPSFRAGASKFLTGGFTDDVAGLGARAGTAVGNLTSGVDPSFQEDPAEAAKVAREAQRAKEEAAYQADPAAYGQGALSGMVGGAALPIGRGNTFAARAKTAVPAGMATGYGMANTEDDGAAMIAALLGGGVGALAAGVPNAVNAVKEGWPALKAGAQQMGRGAKNVVANPGDLLDEAPVVGPIVKKGRALFKAGAAPPAPAPSADELLIKQISGDAGFANDLAGGAESVPATGLVDDLMQTMDDVDLGSATNVEREALLFEGGTAGAQPRESPIATPSGAIDREAARAQIEAIKAGTPVPRVALGKTSPGRKTPLPRPALVDDLTAQMDDIDANRVSAFPSDADEAAKMGNVLTEDEWMKQRMSEALRTPEQFNPNGKLQRLRASESLRSPSKGALQRAPEQMGNPPTRATGPTPAANPTSPVVTDQQILETADHLRGLPDSEKAKALGTIRQAFGPNETKKLLRLLGVLDDGVPPIAG